jgi:hypothetical protein
MTETRIGPFKTSSPAFFALRWERIAGRFGIVLQSDLLLKTRRERTSSTSRFVTAVQAIFGTKTGTTSFERLWTYQKPQCGMEASVA